MKLATFVILLLSLSLHAADDGGLTGEPDPVRSVVQDAALAVRDIAKNHERVSAQHLSSAVAAIENAGATAFWSRLGTKGKRTLRFLNDLATAAGSLIHPSTTAAMSKWSANPDNTVSVAP